MWIEGEDFYYNKEGLIVLTEKYHLEKGYCCGNGCKHCPYDFINVPESKRDELLSLRQDEKNIPKKRRLNNSKTKSGKQTLPLDPKTGGFSFFRDVYDVVRQIPKGRVTSYGAIAAYLGTKLSARMVGWAMNAAGTARPKVPAHRVVNRNGMLTGKFHFSTPTLMEELLKKEKISVTEDKIVNYKTLFWDPAEELNL